MILRDGFRFFSTRCSSLLTLPLSFLRACSSVEPSQVNADGGAEVFLAPTLKPSGHSDTTPLQRVLLLHPEAPRVHWEQPPSWNCQRNQSFPWKFKSGGRGRSSLRSPREISCPGVLHHAPVLMCLCPVRGINQVCRGKGRSPAMSYIALGLHSPGTWCKYTVRTQPCPSARKKGEME